MGIILSDIFPVKYTTAKAITMQLNMLEIKVPKTNGKSVADSLIISFDIPNLHRLPSPPPIKIAKIFKVIIRYISYAVV